MKARTLVSKTFAAFFAICCLVIQTAHANVSVTVQPQSEVSFVGSNSTFTAQVTTTAGEVITSYTWKFSSNNLPPFNTIAGANSSVLTINNTQLTNSGFYFVSLTYNSGTNVGLTAVSTAATLNVEDQARLTSQPVGGLTRSTGDSVTFTVSALGQQPLSYQWRLNGVNLVEGGRISGSTTNSVTISGLLTSDSGGYDVVVSNVFAVVTSHVATVTVYIPPFIAVQPTDLAVVVGSNAVFQVVEGGSQPLTFQWQKDGVNLNNGGRISGATNDTLTIANTTTNDAGNYSVTFFNPVGSTNSVPALLTVLVPPVITSATNATTQQGFQFTYTITATGSLPMTFGADGLPAGLGIDFNSGIISGIPAVFGVFNITLYATNAAAVAATNLLLTVITDVPGITSKTNATGKQGTVFTYTITASNNPVTFTAIGLPPGINLDPLTGIISGPPLYSGTNVITITAANQYGSATTNVTLNIASGVPSISSKLTANGTENQTNFTYTITANNSPTIFGAVGLPQGLTVNTNTGVISGALVFGGTNNFTIWAANAYGTGSNSLQLRVAYAPLPGLAITDVTAIYSKPYLLDFTFSLRDDPNAATNSSLGNAVLRPPEQIAMLCMEGDTNLQVGIPIPDETAFVVARAIDKKLFKTSFVLDYTYSMFITSNAIPDMQAAVENLIDQEPPTSQFEVYEFSADYLTPQLVTTNGFTADKALLTQEIEGIQTNFVQGNYAGTRLYDAINAALGQFTGTNFTTEEHFAIIMSDGNDDSSLLTGTTNFPNVLDVLVNAATNAGVKLYCVGFGPNPNTNVLQYLASQTQGRYYAATTAADLATQFALLLKDLDSEYLLRWATLQRTSNSFQPMFQVTIDTNTAIFNTNFGTMSVMVGTNMTNVSLSLVPLYTPTQFAGNVQIGALDLYADSTSNASSVTLNAFYVPRFVREVKVHYAPNYPCTPILLSNGTNDFLQNWSLTQTNDPTNGFWLTLASPNPSNSLTSMPYGIMGDLVNFQFKFQALTNPAKAFSLFTVDNTIYSNMPPSGQSFVLTNANAFSNNFPPIPPFGTPPPWLAANGFTNNPATDELFVTNGLPLWQWYILGLNPFNPSNSFIIPPIQAPSSNSVPVVTFNSAVGRTYRVDAAVMPGEWFPLQDNIPGTGFPISIPDDRNLSGVSSMFYRVVATY